MKSRHWASTIQAPLFKTLILCFIVTMKPQNAPQMPKLQLIRHNAFQDLQYGT